jgi:hypothetical protein
MNGISGVHSHAVFSRQPTAAPVEDKRQTENPAQSARAALADRADLASKPFGSIASLFARGLPLPPMETVPDPLTPDPVAPDTEAQDSAASEFSGA